MNDKDMKTMITNMIDTIKNENDELIHLDIVLSGGAFNAIYLVGCLLFLKEMQYKNKIMTYRISSCSASSFIALLYLTNNLDLFHYKIYDIVVKSFKKNKKCIFTEDVLNHVFNVIETTLYDIDGLTEYEILKKINYKLYISYFDIKKCKRVVKKKYNSLHEIFETIKKSCHVPFITFTDALYQKRYMDGWYPYIFKTYDVKDSKEMKNIKKKQLYIDLLGKDKVKESFVLKGNKTKTEKVVNGLLDTYSFFSQNGKNDTSMCSYLDRKSIYFYIKYNSLYVFSNMLCIFLYLYLYFFERYSYQFMNIYFVKVFLEFIKSVFYFFIEYICL